MTIRDLLDRLGIKYLPEGHEHCRPGWIQIDCPKCTKPGHWRYGINVRFVYGNCWSCGRIGLASALAANSGKPYKLCRELLDGIAKGLPNSLELRPRGRLVLPEGLGPLQPVHRRYLERRGLDPDEMIRLWDLQGIGIAPRLQWRIFIPFYYHGNIVSWTTRSIRDDDQPGLRYISAGAEEESVAAKHDLLYGEDYARQSIIVTEGQFDVLRLGPGAVATSGTGYSTTQLGRIACYPSRIICFDNEPAAQARATKLFQDLSTLPGQTTKVKIDSKDPGSATDEEIKQLRLMLTE